MKKLLAIITIAAFTACGSNQNDTLPAAKNRPTQVQCLRGQPLQQVIALQGLLTVQSKLEIHQP